MRLPCFLTQQTATSFCPVLFFCPCPCPFLTLPPSHASLCPGTCISSSWSFVNFGLRWMPGQSGEWMPLLCMGSAGQAAWVVAVELKGGGCPPLIAS